MIREINRGRINMGYGDWWYQWKKKKNCFRMKILEITANENEQNKNSTTGILTCRCSTLRTYHFTDLLTQCLSPRAVPRAELTVGLQGLWAHLGNLSMPLLLFSSPREAVCLLPKENWEFSDCWWERGCFPLSPRTPGLLWGKWDGFCGCLPVRIY